MFIKPMLIAASLLFAQSSSAAVCEAETFETNVSGEEQCLLMRRFGDVQPDTMLVWLHGDVSAGGPANYHFKLAEKSAADYSKFKALSVALVRPGYPDGDGQTSSVSMFHSGRRDHHTKENIEEVGFAIERLRNHFKPKHVMVIGHSGGANTAAIILGMKPKIIDSVVLVGCACDLVTWRSGRSHWSRSEDPIKWAQKIEKNVRVIALTGEKDDNTFPSLSQSYVQKLKDNGIQAEFQLLHGENHNSSFRSPLVSIAIEELLEEHRKKHGTPSNPSSR